MRLQASYVYFSTILSLASNVKFHFLTNCIIVEYFIKINRWLYRQWIVKVNANLQHKRFKCYMLIGWGLDCVLCFLFYILLALSFNLLISLILSPTPFQLQAIKYVGKDKMSGKIFFTWHLEFLPSFRFLIKYKKSEQLCIYFFFNLPHKVSLRVGEISVGSQTGSSSLGIHSFFLSFFTLSSSLIALQSMIYRFYFFFNLLDKSLIVPLDRLSAFIFAPYYFPRWNLKSHLFFFCSTCNAYLFCAEERCQLIFFT